MAEKQIVRVMILTWCLLWGSAALAQRAPATQPVRVSSTGDPPSRWLTTAKPVEGAMRLELMDDSVITGKLEIDVIVVQTEFGELKVPIARILSFTPGLDNHPQLHERINALIDQLGSTSAQERDAAQRALLGMGLTVKAQLQSFKTDKDYERRMRIKRILDELAEMADDEDDQESSGQSSPGLIALDTIETPDFIIVGRIKQKSFRVTSRYGPLLIKLADIRRVASPIQPTASALQKKISVEGRYIVQRQYKDSKVRVARGDKVSIKADGMITLTPWGSTAFSTPDGTSRYGWYIQGKIPVGTLMARIGKNGTQFKVGSSHKFTARQAGTLQFGIAMHNSHTNQTFPGKYTVRIKVQRQ